jgi:4-alpha-glucanotransferase
MKLTKAEAAEWGVASGYFDVQGRRHEADDTTLARIVAALAGGGNQPAPADQQVPTPRLAYQGDGRRGWILAVQLYGVRSQRNWGHGDFTDLGALLELIADLGGAGIGLNPLHAQFYDRTGSGSPYSPNSRLFLNPLYIDVAAVDEFDADAAASLMADIDRLRAATLVDYGAAARVKLAALRGAYRAFVATGSEVRRRDFEEYRQARGVALERFSAFEMLRGRFLGPWWDWPEQWREPSEAALHDLRRHDSDELGFHQFLQWNAERQLQKCRDIARRRSLSIGLYLDTAIGVDPAGADAWMNQNAVLRGLSVGAPADQFNPAGQDWGLTVYNPHGLAAERFEPFRAMLRAAMHYAGAIRIDHVLGLMRIFVIPHGSSARQGTYLRMPFEAMLDVVAEESNCWRCITIGEDLGTVPEGFRATLSAWGIWSYLVMLFERTGDGSFRRPADYPERAIATLNTHDMPTYAGWMSGHDLATKRAIGVDPGETDHQRDAARTAMTAAVAGTTGNERIGFEDVVGFLATAPTRLVSIAIEDVLGVADQVNIPGTVEEHPNWRRRWPVLLEQLADDQRLRRIAALLARAGRGSAPAS